MTGERERELSPGDRGSQYSVVSLSLHSRPSTSDQRWTQQTLLPAVCTGMLMSDCVAGSDVDHQVVVSDLGLHGASPSLSQQTPSFIAPLLEPVEIVQHMLD